MLHSPFVKFLIEVFFNSVFSRWSRNNPALHILRSLGLFDRHFFWMPNRTLFFASGTVSYFVYSMSLLIHIMLVRFNYCGIWILNYLFSCLPWIFQFLFLTVLSAISKDWLDWPSRGSEIFQLADSFLHCPRSILLPWNLYKSIIKKFVFINVNISFVDYVYCLIFNNTIVKDNIL